MRELLHLVVTDRSSPVWILRTGDFLLGAANQQMVIDEYVQTAVAEVVHDPRFLIRRVDTLFEEAVVALRSRVEQMTADSPAGLNPISSALNYLEAIDEFGESASEAREAREYVLNDSRTALFEALIDRGHISETKSNWDDETQSFESNGMSIKGLLENSLLDSRVVELEQERRLVELHEELFIEELFRQDYFKDSALLTISPFPDNMDINVAGSLGYKPENRKYMIRWVEVDGSGNRTTKQLSMSGSNNSVLSDFMRENNFLGEEDLSATEILAKRMIVDKNKVSSLVAVAQRIDELTDGEVFLGGEPNGDDYRAIEQLSKERERKVRDSIVEFSEQLVVIAENVVNSKLDLNQAQEQYKTQLRRSIDKIASREPEMAREAIGDSAADQYVKAQWYEAQGYVDEAIILRLQAVVATKEIYVCGMGIEVEANEELTSGVTSSDGESCPEIENGQRVKCPGCKNMVNVIVEGSKKDKLFCPLSDCKLAKNGKKMASAPRKTNIFNLVLSTSKKKDKQPDKLAA